MPELAVRGRLSNLRLHHAGRWLLGRGLHDRCSIHGCRGHDRWRSDLCGRQGHCGGRRRSSSSRPLTLGVAILHLAGKRRGARVHASVGHHGDGNANEGARHEEDHGPNGAEPRGLTKAHPVRARGRRRHGRNRLYRRRHRGTVALGAYERTRGHVGPRRPSNEGAAARGDGTGRRNRRRRRQPRRPDAAKDFVLASGDGEVGSSGGAAIERKHVGIGHTCTSRSIAPCRYGPRN